MADGRGLTAPGIRRDASEFRDRCRRSRGRVWRDLCQAARCAYRPHSRARTVAVAAACRAARPGPRPTCCGHWLLARPRPRPPHRALRTCRRRAGRVALECPASPARSMPAGSAAGCDKARPRHRAQVCARSRETGDFERFWSCLAGRPGLGAWRRGRATGAAASGRPAQRKVLHAATMPAASVGRPSRDTAAQWKARHAATAPRSGLPSAPAARGVLFSVPSSTPARGPVSRARRRPRERSRSSSDRPRRAAAAGRARS